MPDERRQSLFDRDPSAGDQLGAARALVVIIERAAKNKLQPIDWDLGDLGSSLVARATQNVSTPDVGDPGSRHDYAATAALRRQVFDQYLELFRDLCEESVARYGPDRHSFTTELIVHPERVDRFGATRLMAVLKHVTIPLGNRREKFLHTLVVAADIEADPDAVES